MDYITIKENKINPWKDERNNSDNPNDYSKLPLQKRIKIKKEKKKNELLIIY